MFVPSIGIISSGVMEFYWGLELFGGTWLFSEVCSIKDSGMPEHALGKLANKANSFCQRIICSPEYPQSSKASTSNPGVKLSVLLQKEKQAWLRLLKSVTERS